MHPAVLNSYLNNSMPEILKNLRTPKTVATHSLSPDETAMLHLLMKQLSI